MSSLLEHLQDLKTFHAKRDTPEYQALIWNMVGAHLDELIALAEKSHYHKGASAANCPICQAHQAPRPEEKGLDRETLGGLLTELHNISYSIDYCGSYYATKDGPMHDYVKAAMVKIRVLLAAKRVAHPSPRGTT